MNPPGTTAGMPAGSDVPTAPSGPMDWLGAVLSLSVVPMVAVAFCCWALYVYRERIVGIDHRFARVGTAATVVLGVALAGDFLAGGLVAGALQLGSLPSTDLLAVTTAIGALLVADRVTGHRGPAVAVLLALLAWAVGWGFAIEATASPIVDGPIGTVDGFRLALSAVIPLSYPYGRALAATVTDGDRRWPIATAGMLVATAPLSLAAAVPLPGGPAFLVVPAATAYILVALLVGTPLLALGAGSVPGNATGASGSEAATGERVAPEP